MKIHADCAALWASHVRKGNGTAINQKRKPPMKAKSSRFDSLVARYYPAVYSFASRLTDDPREAVMLTRDAFKSTRKQLRNRRDGRACVNPDIRYNPGGSYRRLSPSSEPLLRNERSINKVCARAFALVEVLIVVAAIVLHLAIICTVLALPIVRIKAAPLAQPLSLLKAPNPKLNGI
jgi:hypothetical protein